MPVEKLKLYEAMFLVDSALGGAELPGVVQEIVAILKRRGGAIRQIQRWADRKLAYDIKGIKRGLYLLVHFDAPSGSIAEMRHDISITERLVRVLILRVPEVPAPTGDLLNESGEEIPRPKPVQSETPEAATAEASAQTSEKAEEGKGGESK